eukprot:COSAG01_NODE_72429_length_253_cov_0.642857_1_plen_39_part_10
MQERRQITQHNAQASSHLLVLCAVCWMATVGEARHHFCI